MHMNDDLLNLRTGFAVIGHRGAAGLAPENTLPSFAKALSLGCTGIELDVHAVQDQQGATQLCVIHDKRVDRTTNASGLVADYSVEALAALDAGSGAGVPTLAQVAGLMASSASTLINIELKGADTAAATAAFLGERPNLRALVSSFDHSELRNFRALNTTTAVAPLFASTSRRMLSTAQQLNASCINISLSMATAELLKTCSEAGYPVLVYTVNEPTEAIALKTFGAAGIFTDFPDRMVTL